MKATKIIDVGTNFDLKIAPSMGAVPMQMEQVEVGPTLDVVPYVLSDGYTINLALIPSDTEFGGYDDQLLLPQVTGNLNVVQLPTLLPAVFTICKGVATVNVWDNQTVVLGGLPEKSYYLHGKEFNGKSKASDKELLVLITATIVDPAGNRVHSEDELPFAKDGVPAPPK